MAETSGSSPAVAGRGGRNFAYTVLPDEEGAPVTTTYAREGTRGDIAFLGPAGTYCDEAAQRFAERLGRGDASLLPCPSFNRVFGAVESGRAEFGVVALENSIEGPVTATLDAFAERTDAVVLGEEVVDVRHCLLLHPGASRDDVKLIVSHPQALAQCRGYLERNFPDTPIRSTGSTSDAAMRAVADKSVAAIANHRAAELTGAVVAEADIADHRGDQTNFALIARAGHSPVFPRADSMKTSLALYLRDDRPGSLQMILSEFTYGGINLTKVQSRPTKRRLGEYMFFIDIDGAVDDEPVRIALDCLRLKLRVVKVLGCYPRAQSAR